MAEKYFYTVAHGTHSRSNKDGSVTTFMPGETMESEEPDLDSRYPNLKPGKSDGKLPSAAGFVPKPSQEVHSVTAAAAKATEVKNMKAEPARPAVGERTVVADRRSDVNAVTEKSSRETPHIDTGKK